jgi:hypothetical protein
MVSIDTVTLHLAHASSCPVIAFTNGTGFGATPARGNTLLRVPYANVQSRWHEIASILNTTLAPDSINEDMVLVYQHFVPTNPDTKRRQDEAWATWPLLGARMLGFCPSRSSTTVGEPSGVPFIRDMFKAAMSTGSESIVVLTNNDIKFDPRLKEAIKQSCRQYGCYWAFRTEKFGGPTDEGADVFAFTRKWWAMHQHLYPDYLLGYWWWDSTLDRIMMWSGCGEQDRLYYHETHHSTDSGNRSKSNGTLYNEKLARAWLGVHDEDEKKATYD